MPINTETLNRKLYNKLSKYSPKPLDATGKVTPVEDEADVFKFKFTMNGKDYGDVFATVDDERRLILYYGDDVGDSPETPTPGIGYNDTWLGFVEDLKSWKTRNGFKGWQLKNQDQLAPDMARRNHMKKKDNLGEAYYPMGKKASYSDSVPTIKMVIQHTRQIEEGEQRYRNIAKIFLENELGERYLAPTLKPGIARVYARHVAEGGKPNDERWNHINSLCEEYSKMAGFVRATRGRQFNESAQQLVESGIQHYYTLRESLSKMTGHRGYNAYFENWTPALMEDDTDATNINELFVQETVDPRIETVMPILSRLHKKVAETKIDHEINKLAEWAESLEVAEDDGMQSNNPVGIPESLNEFNPVVQAITRRIVMQYPNLLQKYGPEKVGDAIDSVAEFVGDVYEIGSSDVSGWVKQVERELNNNQVDEGIADDYEHMSDRELMRHAGMLGLEKSCVPDEEGGLANRREIIYLLQKEADGDLEESGLQAYLGNKKYGKKGMDALRKAGREHASKEKMDKIRNKYNKLDEENMEEGVLDTVKKVGGKVLDKLGHGSDEELLKNLQKRAGIPTRTQNAKKMAIVKTNKPIGTRVSDIGPGGKEHNIKTDSEWDKQKGVAEGYILKKTNVDKHVKPGDPDDYTDNMKVKNTDYEIINNKTGQVVGVASWTTNDYFGPGALQITMKNGATRYLDIWEREKGNPQTAFNRFVKDPKTAKKYKEQGVAEDLDANQKRVGQLGPTEKVKNNNIGKLVGANENFINMAPQAVAEGLDAEKRERLDALISQYADSVDPEAYYGLNDEYPDSDEVIAQIRQEFGDKIADTVEAGASKMHFPRDNYSFDIDTLQGKTSPRITKLGKINKQDSDYMKREIKRKMGIGEEGEVQTFEGQEDLNAIKRLLGK